MTLHWYSLLVSQDRLSHQLLKLRWKILRQGMRLESVLDPGTFSTSWELERQTGSEETGAIKLMLRSVVWDDRCEMVVLFPKGKRATVCVSSQIGCGVGCQFCATGTMGFRRNLSAEEILEQVYLARVIATEHDRHLRNVVFMGMGEPLHNTENVLTSIDGMISDTGFGLSPRCITLSTSGVPANVLTAVSRFPRLRLAISLHSANRELRRSLMPRIANDLTQLHDTIAQVNRMQPGQSVWLEYVLLRGVNDSLQDAQELIDFCKGLDVEINLIPWNAIEGDRPWESTSREDRERFAAVCRQAGWTTTIRQSFGDESASACGQLVVRETSRERIGALQEKSVGTARECQRLFRNSENV